MILQIVPFNFTVFIIPHRLIVSTMGFLAIMLAYTIRTSLSLSITKMVKSHGHSASAQECLADDNGTPGSSVSKIETASQICVRDTSIDQF